MVDGAAGLKFHGKERKVSARTKYKSEHFAFSPPDLVYRWLAGLKRTSRSRSRSWLAPAHDSASSPSGACLCSLSYQLLAGLQAPWTETV